MMKRIEWKKYILALALAVMLCALFLSAQASSAEADPSGNGWKGGDPSCQHLHISWVSDGNLRHHAVCEDCAAEGRQRAHTTEYRPASFSYHTLECNLCREKLGEGPHSFTYQSNGQSGHIVSCLTCGFAISVDHSLVCVNDGEASHHWECVVCGAITATASHRLLPRNVGNERHCYACKDCTYSSAAVPCSYTATSQGKAGHVLKCVVCSATTGNVEPHHLTWVSEGLTGHHEGKRFLHLSIDKLVRSHQPVKVFKHIEKHFTCSDQDRRTAVL